MTTVLVRADTLLDGTGAPAIRGGAAVLIADGTIQAVGPRDAVAAPTDAAIVELADASILPGIVDGHVHLMLGVPNDPFHTLAQHAFQTDRSRMLLWGAANALACLAAGLTTMFDCGGPGDATIVLRDAIRDGLVMGPRMLAAGAPITTTAGHCNWLGNRADNRAEVVKAVRTLVQQEADFVKVMATGGSLTPASNRYTCQYSQEEMTALAAEAHRLRRRVVAHCNAADGIRRSTIAGIDTLAHCNWLGPTADYLDYDDAVAKRMGEQGMFVDLNIGAAVGRLADHDGVLREWPHESSMPETRWEIGKHMQRYGVGVYLSSDAIGRDYGILPRNLIGMPARFGDTPADLISRVSGVPARAMGRQEQFGTIRPGLSADLLLVRGDAEHDLSGLARPELVLLRGEVVAERGKVRLAARHQTVS
jgi:imidazolonepropionase-like amidohydrolase